MESALLDTLADMSSTNTSRQPLFEAAPLPEDDGDATCENDEETAYETVVVWSRDVDWYLDETETEWLTAKEVRQRFGRSGDHELGTRPLCPSGRPLSIFGFDTDVTRDAFGLRSARRKHRSSSSNARPRRYRVYEYPLELVEAWAGESISGAPVWLSAAEVEAWSGRDRTTFQHAVAKGRAGLRTARRIREVEGSRVWSGEVYIYPRWRIAEWAGASSLTPATLPTASQIAQLRSGRDAAASLLARSVGFSEAEVRAAAGVGDLNATPDPNTGKLLFLPVRSTHEWMNREVWKRTG